MQSLMKNSNMIRPSIWETQDFYIIKLYIFEKFSLRAFEWHDAESELYQKLLVADIFPGKLLTGHISVTKFATPVKKYFFGSTALEESIRIYG